MRNILAILIISALICLVNNSTAQPSISNLSAPSDITENEWITLTAQLEDPAGGGLKCEWDFGDGNSKVLFDRPSVGWSFDDDGDYTVTLKVTDIEDQSATATVNVTVKNEDPEIHSVEWKRSPGGSSVDLWAFATDAAYSKDDLNYTWDFGDGRSRSGLHLREVTHRYNDPGSYTVMLEVDDGDGGTDTETITVTVDRDWEATVSGDVGAYWSGGTALIYTNYVKEGTDETVRCFKSLVLYDDDNHSFIWFAENQLTPLTNNTHSLSMGSPYSNMGCMAWYNLPPTVYPMLKGRHLPAEVLDIVGESPLGMLREINDLGDIGMGGMGMADLSNAIRFDVVGGQLNVGPWEEDAFKGTFSLTMEETAAREEDQPPRMISITGSFKCNLNDWSRYGMENGCENPPPEFTLISHAPKNNKENVHRQFPCIELEFSDKVDITSFSARSFEMGYYDGDGNFRQHPCSFELDGEQKVKVNPSAPLRSAIKYKVVVKAGDEGPRSTDGGKLDKEYEFEFSSMVEPNDAQVRVYQVVADKPLVPGKEALVRCELYWSKPDDVADQSFVKQFPARVSLKNEGGRNLCRESRRVTIKHFEEYDREDIRHARNSITIYGWKPNQSDGEKIKLVIEPLYQECVPDDEKIKFNINHAVDYWDMSPDLRVDYYFLGIQEWENGLPPEAAQTGHQIMTKAMPFGEQIFPVKSMRSRSKGTYVVDTDLYFDDPLLGIDAPYHTWDLYKFRQVLRDFYFDVGIHSNADVVLVFYPLIESMGRGGGWHGSVGNPGNSSAVRPGQRLISMTLTDAAITRPVIEHEIGHSFGLPHVPYARDAEHRAYIASFPIDHWENEDDHLHISGFRIFKGRDQGKNKDCEEGNAEFDKLGNLMHPSQGNVFRPHVWINDWQYNKVMTHLEYTTGSAGLLEYERENARYWASITAPVAPPAEDMQVLTLSGIVSRNGKSGQIERATSTAPIVESLSVSGAYNLIAFDSQGKTIGSVTFNPIDDHRACQTTSPAEQLTFFTQLLVPMNATVSHVELKSGAKTLHSHEVSASVPEVRFIWPESGDVLRGDYEFEWEGSDADGDRLTYTLLYSPNGVDSWSPVARTSASTVELDVESLGYGESPTFKVDVSDGFNSSSVLRPVEIEFSFEVDYFLTDTVDAGEAIAIKFTNPILPQSLSGSLLEFKNVETGRTVSSIAYRDNDPYVVHFSPVQNLDSGSRYTCTFTTMDNETEPSERGADPFSNFSDLVPKDDNSTSTGKGVVSGDVEEGAILDINQQSLSGPVSWQVYVR